MDRPVGYADIPTGAVKDVTFIIRSADHQGLDGGIYKKRFGESSFECESVAPVERMGRNQLDNILYCGQSWATVVDQSEGE